ncbi:MAG TPA: PEP/pyruvate-binding domain-containing protein [Streptosporangiaceae bacterium]|jgi:pyruvate,water dikinase
MTTSSDAPATAPARRGKLTVPLGTDGSTAAAQLGGKAANLDRLIRERLPVPPAFCITSGALRRFLEQTGLTAEIPGADHRTIRAMIAGRRIPAGIAEEILTAYADLGRPAVAVRSSALGEDSAEHSFAGQHDTVLDVRGDAAVLDAVKTCWASLWSDRAAAYRHPGHQAQAMAVIVQAMVPAEVSGVLFTVDPVGGRPHRLVVEACHGLGEGLVSGRVSSDSFVLDDRSGEVIEEHVRYKVTRCTMAGPGRTGLAKVDAPARGAPCLTRPQLRQLGQFATQIRDCFGGEQDIEWSLADGQLWILQARPITTRPAGTVPSSPYIEPQIESVQQGTLWSRMDIGEIFVGQMTPLGLSFARHHQRHVHGDCAAAVGTRDRGDFVGYMGYLQGHVYLNVSYTAYLLGQCLPTRDQSHFTSRFVSEEVSLEDYRNPFGAFPGGRAAWRETLHWIKITGTELVRMKRRAHAMTQARLQEFDRVRRIDFTRLSRAELHSELSRYLVHYHDMHVGYMPYYINAFSAYGLLTELCVKWLGDAGENLQNRIKTDMSGLRTVASAREIWQLAQAAAKKPKVLRIIRETPLEGIETALRADRAGRAFWDRHMEQFLRINGVRGHQEMELTHPRWVDDPSYIFQMIRRYAGQGSAPGPARAVSRVDAGELLATLPRAKRRVLKQVLWLYTTCSELREVARMAMITSLWMIRKVVYELGRRLTDEGILQDPGEVAYLELDDIRAYLGGTAPAGEIFTRAKIDRARRLHDYQRRLPEPPLSFIGEYDPRRAAAGTADGDGILGVPASPGRVVARARIVEDLVWQADEFQDGEILVTRYTDASWTPLFAIAAGVVTDIGSMLSHSSIVAREFGVPSVVNTKNATQRINTGDLIVVDGDAGTVEIAEIAGVVGAAEPAQPEGESTR